MLRKLSWLLCLFISWNSFSQSNFSYTPEHPKAGDLITITYEPAGVLAGNLKFVDAVFYTRGGKNINADDISLKRMGKKFTGTVQTDTANSFVFFGFSIDNQFDNNFNNGYYILLDDNDGKAKKGANEQLSYFYQYNGVGVDRNNDKALAAIEKEMELFASERSAYIPTYVRLINQVKKQDAPAIIQKEIEALLKNGLAKEQDYETLEGVYTVAKLPEQAKLIASMKKEKYPKGRWTIMDQLQKLSQEKDPEKAKALSANVVNKIKTDPDWKYLESSIGYYSMIHLFKMLTDKNWEGLQKELAAAPPLTADLANLYNEVAWELQKTSSNLPFAEEIARKATEFTKNQMLHPTEKKPSYLTTKQWNESRKFTYTQYADTYGMVLYRKGEYKKGFALMQEVMKMDERKSIDHNNTYALLAEKVLPAKQYKTEMEAFLKEDKATSSMTDGLKAIYVKQKGNDKGFDNYVMDLKKEAYMKMLEDLRKSMLNETAPTFALLDLDGKKVNLPELKGKTVIVDFWATWCGPCKASFPGMQKMVNRYKDDPNVKFVFIDTWETGDDRTKKVAGFIAENKYSFHVLLDEDNKVVEQFKVEGIPTKFVIDRNGKIRFKSVGFNGSDDKLISELTAMIDLASTDQPKKVL